MDFSKPWKDSDLTLKVEGESLHVHRLILSLNSPVFDRMFNSDFREKNSNEIELPGKKVNEIKEMLGIIYDRSKEITDSNFAFLLALSDEFQLTQIHSQCVKYIKEADKSGLNALKYIDIVNKFNLKSLEDICLHNIKTVCSNRLSENVDFQELDDSTKLLIMKTRVEHTESIFEKVEKPMNLLLKHLYLSANLSYIDQLRHKGYEETVLSYCDKRHEHKVQKPGIKFDVDCQSCRNRLKVSKEFSVKTNDVCELMEDLYILKDEFKT